ncbi:hypothetical protein BCR32DRAFT_292411 [Anaeromyces robustus]|uniref:EGF-like domain-containing protein n=1 Tax=Anaeromyces robustus TaxID=1754192 RepID=A0A1Y1XAK1_9FUNG|nr:hypothetical protein BCR32DRAFT_292411 [Anaeromyces robustus]|eukprot:ORX82768.1 hypothetical protein BCR32DRAFT_292411 [Anaeromyces robustus]
MYFKKFFLSIQILFILQSFIIKVYSLEIILNNKSPTLESIASTVTNALSSNDVKVILPDNIYKIPISGQNTFNIKNTLTFYSKDGSTFDFQNSEKGSFNINIGQGLNKKKLVFENIHFKNFKSDSLRMFDVKYSDETNTFSIEFINCTFDNNIGTIFNFGITCTSSIQSSPQVLFNNCRFTNSDMIFLIYHLNSYYNLEISPDCFNVHFIDCYFENNKYLGANHCGNINIDNCYFTKMNGSNDYECSIVYSSTYRNKVKITNTKFENILVSYNKPMFAIYKTLFEINNCSFINCHSYSNFLIHTKTNVSYKNSNNDSVYISITNSEFNDISTLIEGESNIIHVKDSKFKNIITRSITPILMNSPFSKIDFANIEIKNITSLRSGFFDEETTYSFSNVKFMDIKSNAKAIINTTYKSLSFNNCTFSNILCNGDGENSSLIFINTSINGNTIELNNTIIDECTTNGDLIKITGSLATIKLSNLIIRNIYSYGSIIYNTSSKSYTFIDDTKIYENQNINKLQCGLITSLNSIDMSISKSEFKDNTSKNNGGILCFTNIYDLNLNISSSSFENNSAQNGGAIYLNQGQNKYYSNSIKLDNTKFLYNSVTYNGGAIYSNFEDLNIKPVKKVVFQGNSAYAGGAIYINNDNKEKNTLFNVRNKNIKYYDNSAISHGDNYATGPHMIEEMDENNNEKELVFINGENFFMEFRLVDEFGHVISDIYKYFPNVVLNFDIIYNLNKTYNKITGNNCYFTKGVCSMKNFRIYSSESFEFKLKLSIESKESDIIVDFQKDIFNGKIKDCGQNEIKIFDQNKFYHCEEPECTYLCPILSNKAECLKSTINEENNINDPNNNICSCYSGWSGPYCEMPIYADVKKNDIYLHAIALPINIIIIGLMVFIFCKRHEKIIGDTGYVKTEIFLLGAFIYYICFYFNSFSDYQSCTLAFIFKHCGILLMYSIFIIFASTGCELGVSYEELDRLNCHTPIQNSKPINSDADGSETKISASSYDVLITENIEKELNNISKRREEVNSDNSLNKKRSSMVLLYSQGSCDNIDLKMINKSIFIIHSLNIEVATVYIISCIVFIGYIFYGSSEGSDNQVKDINGRWMYKCSLYQFGFIIDILEFMLVLILILRIMKTWGYTYVFKCLKYIGIASIVWFTLGPLINILSYVLVINDSNAYILFNSIGNGLCYFLIILIYMWDKVYYIMKGLGSDPEYYFNSLKRGECMLHRSYFCGCVKSQSDYETIIRYLNFYKTSSQIIVFSKKGLKYISTKSKGQLKYSREKLDKNSFVNI